MLTKLHYSENSRDSRVLTTLADEKGVRGWHGGLHSGMRVQTVGVVTCRGSQVNGLIGRCLNFRPISCCWEVELVDGTTELLQPENLKHYMRTTSGEHARCWFSSHLGDHHQVIRHVLASHNIPAGEFLPLLMSFLHPELFIWKKGPMAREACNMEVTTLATGFPKARGDVYGDLEALDRTRLLFGTNIWSREWNLKVADFQPESHEHGWKVCAGSDGWVVMNLDLVNQSGEVHDLEVVEFDDYGPCSVEWLGFSADKFFIVRRCIGGLHEDEPDEKDTFDCITYRLSADSISKRMSTTYLGLGSIDCALCGNIFATVGTGFELGRPLATVGTCSKLGRPDGAAFGRNGYVKGLRIFRSIDKGLGPEPVHIEQGEFSKVALSQVFVVTLLEIGEKSIVQVWDLGTMHVVLNICYDELALDISIPSFISEMKRGESLSAATASVIEEISHELPSGQVEPPAEQRHEAALEFQAAEEWASNVEYLLHGPRTFHVVEDSSVAPERVHLLQFGGGDGELLRDSLLHGPQFLPHRAAMENAGQSCQDPSKAIVLVRPEQYSNVRRALISFELRPYNVVLTESFEHMLREVLSAIPCRRRPSEKTRSRQEILVAGMQQVVATIIANISCRHRRRDAAILPADFGSMFDVRRSFICEAPHLREAFSVIQSTTEAVDTETDLRANDMEQEASSYFTHFRGTNPRRVVQGLL